MDPEIQNPAMVDELRNAATKKSPLLLSIPASELGTSSSNGLVSPQKLRQKASQLLLLQLPVGCQSPRKVQYFVGREQAALIVQDQSYSVHRVETSNTLLLIPPISLVEHHHRHPHTAKEQPTTKVAGTDHGTRTTTSEQPSSLLLLDPPPRPVVVVHRLGGGDVSASFLELRRKYLQVSEVISALPVWGDPFESHYDDDNDTPPPASKSLYEISIALQASETELRDFLDNVLDRAVALEDDRYALLTEQGQQICSTAIVATLAEDDDYSESKKTVQLDALVEKAMERIISSERFPNMSLAVRHVLLKSFAVSGSSTFRNNNCDKVILDWTKVAGWVARQLLLSRTEPWPDDDFIVTWQTEMPGITFQVHRDMLQGVAVLVQGTTSWCLVPANGIWTPQELFDVLFHVKTKWFRAELQPYLHRLCQADASIVSAEQLLVRFTAPIQEQLDGLDVTMYQRKG